MKVKKTSATFFQTLYRGKSCLSLLKFFLSFRNEQSINIPDFGTRNKSHIYIPSEAEKNES